MVDVAPNTALLIALGNAYNNARANAPRGGAPGIPGIGGGGAGEPGGTPGLGLASGGVGGASVPGTATTGQNALNSLLGGGASAGDPVAQQVAGSSNFLSRFREESEADLGAGVTGGDAGLLRAILSGNPILMAAMIANAVANEGQIPSDPGDLAAFGDSAFARSEREGVEVGGGLGDTALSGSLPGGGAVNTIRSGFGGGDSTPGASGRDRSLERERTTGRAAGPV